MDQREQDTPTLATVATLRLGVEGWLEDDLAFTRPWGFDLEVTQAGTAPTLIVRRTLRPLVCSV